MKAAYMTRPCENCPYRMDAPRRLWSRIEFENVLKAETADMGTVFDCHKQAALPPEDRGFCVGWALDQKKRGVPSIAFRLLLAMRPDAMDAFDRITSEGLVMFRTVRQMCRANGVRPDPDDLCQHGRTRNRCFYCGFMASDPSRADSFQSERPRSRPRRRRP